MAKKMAVLTGDKKLNRKLARLTGPQAKKAFRQSARPAIKPIQQESKSNSSKHSDTGKLARSYRVRSIPRSRSRIGSRVTIREEEFDSFYAGFREFGWKAGRAKRKVKGTEDMERAAKAKKTAVMRDYKARLAKNIQEIAKA